MHAVYNYVPCKAISFLRIVQNNSIYLRLLSLLSLTLVWTKKISTNWSSNSVRMRNAPRTRYQEMYPFPHKKITMMQESWKVGNRNQMYIRLKSTIFQRCHSRSIARIQPFSGRQKNAHVHEYNKQQAHNSSGSECNARQGEVPFSKARKNERWGQGCKTEEHKHSPFGHFCTMNKRIHNTHISLKA